MAGTVAGTGRALGGHCCTLGKPFAWVRYQIWSGWVACLFANVCHVSGGSRDMRSLLPIFGRSRHQKTKKLKLILSIYDEHTPDKKEIKRGRR